MCPELEEIIFCKSLHKLSLHVIVDLNQFFFYDVN